MDVIIMRQIIFEKKTRKGSAEAPAASPLEKNNKLVLITKA